MSHKGTESKSVEIFIVEDSPTQAEQLKYILEQRGYHVSVANNGEEALILIGKHKPSIVISDIIMPGIDGYQLCRAIKADKNLKDIPVILVTTLSDPKDVIGGLECGADNFILKPYDEDYLLSRLRYIVVNKELHRNEKVEMGLEILFEGQKYFINSERRQILDLLLSTYEAAVKKNTELIRAQDELKVLNEQVERKVEERTAALMEEIAERMRAEGEIRRSNEELAHRVKERTAQLEAANKELEAFSYSVSHDLRAPLRAIDSFSRILLEDYSDKLDDEGKRKFNIIQSNAQNMGQLIDDLLAFSRLGRQDIRLSNLDMGELAKAVFEELKLNNTHERTLQLNVNTLPHAQGDRTMIHQVFVNLSSNAIKFTKQKEGAIIEVDGRIEENQNIYYVKDNGAGFNMQYANKLFGVFQRLHTQDEFEGTGVGLALVQRIIHRHGGRVWAEGRVNEGATFYFTLPGPG